MINVKKRLVLSIFVFNVLFCSCNAKDYDNFEDIFPKLEHRDIVIVGGGISGLTSGYVLRNKDFILLEKNNTVGGRTVSAIHNNFTYTKGTEYLGEPEDYLALMIKELKLELKEIPSPMDAYFDGKSFYYGGDGIKRYLVSNSSYDTYKKFVRLVLDEYKHYDEIPEINYNAEAIKLDNMTAKQWFLNNGLPEVYYKKYNVTSRGLFGASLDEISALSFIPEAAFDYDNSDLISAKKRYNQNINEEYKKAKNEESDSYTFVKGITELTNKLGEVLKSNIRLNSNVVSIYKESDYYMVVYNRNNKLDTIVTKKIVLAVPAPIALNIAPTAISKEKTEIMNKIEFASYATVALFSKTPIFNKAFDLAVPDEYFFTDIYDATWVERFYEKREPTDHIISVYIAPESGKDHSLDTMSDHELIQKVYNDLDKIFPGSSAKITGYDIHRFPYAYPIMSPGAYERLLKLHKLNEGSLILAGDYMIYPTFEAAVESGYIAAEKILEEY